MPHINCRLASALIASLVLTGCARLGEPISEEIVPGAPTLSEIFDDLGSNDAAVQRFRASGTFTLTSPDIEGAVRGRGKVYFDRPDRLHVFGVHRVTGVKVFELTCAGQDFLLDFPAEDLRYFRVQGRGRTEIPFPVAPTELAREMFFPESWDFSNVRQARVVSSPQPGSEAVVDMGPRKRPRRRISVIGPPWVLAENCLLDAHGDVIARTELSDYRDFDGIRFPTRIEAEFPREQTRALFVLRNVEFNRDIDEELFQIDL